MKNILSLFTMLAVVSFLVMVGLVGFLVATGRIDKEKAQTILDLLKHPGTPAGLREHVYAKIDPTFAPATATAPSTEPATAPANGGNSPLASDPASASDRIEYTRQAIEQERLQLEREAQELRHRQELLDQKRAEVAAATAQIDAKQKSFDAQQKAAVQASQGDAFTRSLELYNNLKSKQVKDLFLTLPPETAAGFIKAMEPERAAKIISEFKTDSEKAYISSVLERIRTPSDPAGTTNATAPANDALSPGAAATAAK